MLYFLRKSLIVARYTFVEVYKSKVMMNVILLGASIALVSYIAAEFTYGVPGKVSLDFGLGTLTLSSVGIAIFIGSTLVSKEIESRTIYMALSRPISRTCFLTGRILGMLFFLALNTALLSSIVMICYMSYGGEFVPLIGWSMIFVFLESLLALLIVVAFAMVTNPIMSVVYSLAIYAAGHAIPQTLDLKVVNYRPWLERLIEIYSALLPNFDRLNIKDYILYEQFLPSKFLVHSLLYGICYSFFLYVITIVLFRSKSLD